MIGLIYSQSSNGYIGKDGKLLFSIPEDLQRFKSLTTGNVVIMGRKTWDSLPSQSKPLKNRVNIVLSSMSDNYISVDDYFHGAVIANSFDKALEIAKREQKNIWIIGGESLYNEGLKYADVVEQTFVTKEFEGDAKAPVLDARIWEASVGRHFKEHDGYYYQFNTYRRRSSV